MPRVFRPERDKYRQCIEKIVSPYPPRGKMRYPSAALIFDSLYDTYKGVIAYVRVMEGSVSPGRPFI